MSVDEVESVGDFLSNTYEGVEGNSKSQWNGRVVESCFGSTSATGLSGFLTGGDTEIQERTCKAIEQYFDAEAKEAQEFEITVLLHAIRCSSVEEENKKLRELISIVDKIVVGAGLIAIAVISKDYKSALTTATGLYYFIKEKTFFTFSQLNKFLEERGKDYEDLYFFTLWEDYERNQQELRSKGLILDPYSPHYTEKPLDPTFKPWT